MRNFIVAVIGNVMAALWVAIIFGFLAAIAIGLARLIQFLAVM